MKNEENWSETRLQAECFQWHWNTFQAERGLLHTNNNNSQNKIKGAINKALGVVAGVADMEYVAKHRVYFIEMKLPKGRQDPDQKDFERQVRAQGHVYVIIRSLSAFQALHTDMVNCLVPADPEHYNRLVTQKLV